MEKAGKKIKRQSMKFATILEMLFSLVLIPCGLSLVQIVEEPTPDADKATTLMQVFLLLGLATLMRAVAKRYRKQARERRLVDYVFAGVFLAVAGIIATNPLSIIVWGIANVVFLVSLIPGRVLAIMRNRRWYSVLLNGLIILGIVYFAVTIWMVEEETEIVFMYLTMLTAIMISLRSFFRIMSVTFSRLRMDVLREIVRKTYAAEIISGLFLLILSFSWVMMFTDPAFDSYTDALWYCFAVVTTIGFGDITATSIIARLLSVVLGIYGIIVVALITSIIVNFYGEMKKAGPAEEETASEEEELFSEAEEPLPEGREE